MGDRNIQSPWDILAKNLLVGYYDINAQPLQFPWLVRYTTTTTHIDGISQLILILVYYYHYHQTCI